MRGKMQERAEVLVMFLAQDQGGPRSSVSLQGWNYRPHFRVGEKGVYLGVAFVDGPGRIPVGQREKAVVALIYHDDDFDYAPLAENACFEIMEGPNVVGNGQVIRRYKTDKDWRVLRG